MKKTLQYTLLLLMYCAIALVLPGCATQNKFNKLADKHNDWLAEKCADEFPVQERIIEGKRDTITLTETRTDTVTITNINTVTGKTETIRIPCPPCKSSVRTVFKTDTIIKRDTAKETVFLNQFKNEQTDKIKAETKLEQALKDKKAILVFAIVAALAALVMLFLTLRR